MHHAKGPGVRRLHGAVGAPLARLALGIGLVLAACAGPAGTPPGSGSAPPHVSLQHALDTMLRASSARSAEVFLASLPIPLRVTERRVRNPHQAGVLDTLRTLHFTGLSVVVYQASSTGARFPVVVTVTSPAYRASTGLHVGMRRDRVRALLGPPDASVDDRWIYQIETPLSAPYELTLRFRANRVRMLSWAAYLD